MAKYITAKNLSLLYNVAGMMPFGLMSADMVLEVWPAVTKMACTKSTFGKESCTESLEFTVGKIYLQVMFGMSLFFASQLIFSGKTANLASVGCLVATMGKHIIVDDLIPPPPVMAMTAIVAAAQFAPGAWGQRAFIGFCVLNAFTFLTQPLMVLQDTFPTIVAGSKEATLGAFCLEVIALYTVMAGIVALIPIKAYSLALAQQAGLAVIAKHVLINKSGPPLPMIGLWVVATVLAWKEYGWIIKPACDKAIKSGPMYVHGIVVGTNFVPYFIMEAIGVSAPYVGLAAIDSSYAYGGMTALLTAFLAIYLAIPAWTEYTGHMEGKMFARYHYWLSTVVFLWQCQPTTSDVGMYFFSAPHLFTAWTIYLVVKNSPHDKKD